MHSRQVIFSVALLVAGPALCGHAFALEATTAPGGQASDRSMMRHLTQTRADQIAEVASLQSKANAILACTAKGRFYAPGEVGADANGCIPITVTVTVTVE
ncbi:MAG: hypothetical protein K2Y42_06605 [Hyphomicrobium sp.]|jgi:hypothetical protein|uniref:hypothetical protein n=1 Tax=Hyphomicrobium sp. TaxID=82 RepID=UPI0025C527A8|nr:hypothetical protein [Hyphomicrobium sp.]MBX9862409.1 hypothetical protein [Hyphomicrobium sp.]